MAFDDGFVDFRSDTVTRPTAEMRKAMAAAPVGDDVYGDDPSINELEAQAAEVMGFDSAVFVPSGIMGNQLSIMVHTRPGDDVICDPLAHVRNIERGASAALAGVSFRPMPSTAGRITAEMIDQAMDLAGRFFPRISLACWENTHNWSGGRVIPRSDLASGFAAAARHGLSVHMDGARIFNAAVALETAADRLVEGADTVSICFSKALGAPVGSAVVGSRSLIDEVRYLRGRQGGAMRQAGILAVAASIGLRDRERLIEDHRLARRIAERLADHDPALVDLDTVETNIVNITASALSRPWDELAAEFAAAGIAVNAPFGERFRIVAHRDVDWADAERLLAIICR